MNSSSPWMTPLNARSSSRRTCLRLLCALTHMQTRFTHLCPPIIRFARHPISKLLPDLTLLWFTTKSKSEDRRISGASLALSRSDVTTLTSPRLSRLLRTMCGHLRTSWCTTWLPYARSSVRSFRLRSTRLLTKSSTLAQAPHYASSMGPRLWSLSRCGSLPTLRVTYSKLVTSTSTGASFSTLTSSFHSGLLSLLLQLTRPSSSTTACLR